MRSFIGIDLSFQEKLALETWREQAFPGLPNHKNTRDITSPNKGRRIQSKTGSVYGVPMANFHITLCFTGDINSAQHDKLCGSLDEIEVEPFDINIDTSGFWAKPKIVFTAPSSPPPQLVSLANACTKAAKYAGIRVEQGDYRPHITIALKASETFPIPLIAPTLCVEVKAFHLFESFSDKQGVHYPIRESWSLTSSLSLREQLKRGIVDTH